MSSAARRRSRSASGRWSAPSRTSRASRGRENPHPNPPLIREGRMSNGLANIKHIVVLMLENRSFDNVLGWLYDPQNQPPFDKVPPGQTFEGLAGVTLTNPYNGKNYPPGHGTNMVDPYPDPNDEYERVYMQMYNPDPFKQPNPIPDPAGTPNMQGFVNDYATAKGVTPAQAP